MSRNSAVKASEKSTPVRAAAKSATKADKSVEAPQTNTVAPQRLTPERVASNGLSETALRKAPVADYMNAEQLGFFREMLVQMQKELIENAGITSEHLREHEVEPDPTDQATIEEEYALELRARDRERKLLKKIEQSLRHIDEGTYGWCEETGEAIGIPRLLARPTATLTVEAQSRRELKQKLYGD
ncbi:MAG: RNA polymerase-binding protein DksA [Burkholderiales bacterium]